VAARQPDGRMQTVIEEAAAKFAAKALLSLGPDIARARTRQSLAAVEPVRVAIS